MLMIIDKVNNISSWSFYKIEKYLPELDKLYIPVYKNIYHDYFLFNELFTKLDASNKKSMAIFFNHGSIIENLWHKNINTNITYFCNPIILKKLPQIFLQNDLFNQIDYEFNKYDDNLDFNKKDIVIFFHFLADISRNKELQND